MSLRARLILGMGLVAVVLVATAIVITRATQANLLDQVDARLDAAVRPPMPGCDGDHNLEPRVVPGSEMYFAYVTTTGQLASPVHSDTLSEPESPAARL